MTVRIGIDTGGTFTDVVAVDGDGRVVSTKVPSTPNDPSVAFMRAVEKVGTGEVVHGTTVATNALLEDDFGGLGFITTAGFRGLLEIGRQSVPDSYGNSYFWVKPDRIVPLHLVQEVDGRLDRTGAVIREFDEDGARAVARWFREQGIACIGVCLLHAYMNPEHERRMRDVLAEEHPDCAVSISSDVLSEYREYERSVTTLVDAFVKPHVAAYVRSIEDRLGRPFYIMKSNGGVIAGAEVGEKPITTILSGPAAGTLGAALVAQQAGFDKVITLDGGGTSTDVAVISGGLPSLTTEGSVGRFAVKVPMVDVITVGTGGGSIAWVSPEGTLKVGPRSAGADPGPVCYCARREPSRRRPTRSCCSATSPSTCSAVRSRSIAAPPRPSTTRWRTAVGLSREACAAGVLEIAAWNQANAIRQVTVKRGLDVRDFDLCAFGGSGPLTACRLIDILGLRTVFVPRDPGNLSAFGLLATDLRSDHVQTLVRRHIDLEELAPEYARLEASALDDVAGREASVVRSADLRYFGQAFEINVPAPGGPIDAGFVEQVEAGFHDAHERLYGYCYRDDAGHAVEWVNLRVTGVGAMPRPELAPVAAAGDAREGTRPVYFDGWHDTPVYARDRLGGEITGPAIIQEFGSTLPIHPGFTARVDELGNVVVRREA